MLLMQKKIRIILCAVALLICFCNPRVSAQSSIKDSDSSQTEARELFESFLEGRLTLAGEGTEQEFIDRYLCDNLSLGSEWYALALSQSGAYDFQKYSEALLGYLSKKEINSPSTAKKYALCLAAMGSNDAYIANRLEDELGDQGVMELVFSLHLLNNRYSSSKYSSQSLCEAILSLRLDDGGWAVSGGVSDVDVTAMVLQALAPLSNRGDGQIDGAVERAVDLLSERQLADGDFMSYGKPNAESCAQVIIALSALGIDASSDERFIKNGNSAADGIKKYRLEDGSFSSQAGGGASELANLQSFCAAAAYLRMLDGKGSLYLLDHATPESLEEPSSEEGTAAEEDVGASEAHGLSGEGKNGDRQAWIKLAVCLAIAAAALIGALVLIILKKRSPLNFLAIAILAAISITAVILIDLRSPQDYYGSEEKKSDICGSVTLSIRCDALIGKAEGIESAEKALLLAPVKIELARGESVYDILVQAARRYGIRFEIDGTANNAYVIGIGDLYEHDYGELSGWTYFVNGESAPSGCSYYKLSDGDVIEWHYTCELGQDIDNADGTDNN